MATDFDPYQEWLGIAPHERPVNHYRLLDIAPFTTDADVIREAADQRMGQIRQYQMGKRGAQTQPILNALSAAKLCLLNPNTKATYDAVLEASLGMQQPEHNLRSAPTSKGNAAPLEPPPVASSPPPEPPLAEPPVEGPPVQEPPLPEPLVYQEPVRIVDSTHESLPAARRRASNLPLIMVSLGVLLVVIVGAAIYQLSRPTEPPVVQTDHAPPPKPEVVPSATEQPAADQPVVTQQEGSGSIVFRPAAAELAGSLKLENTSEGDAIIDWGSSEARVRWHFHLTQPGVFRAEVVYRTAAAGAGGSFQLVSPDNFQRKRSVDADAVGTTTDGFAVPILRGGDQVLEFIPKGIATQREFQLVSVELVLTRGGQ
jgi:hypothetical protein